MIDSFEKNEIQGIGCSPVETRWYNHAGGRDSGFRDNCDIFKLLTRLGPIGPYLLFFQSIILKTVKSPRPGSRYLGILAGAGMIVLLLAFGAEAQFKRVRQKVKHEDLIVRYARERHLPTSLLKAIIKTESNFNKHAVSPKGAKGLMQLMPGTWKRFGVENPFDPEQNVRAGSAYLLEMMKRFHNLPLALAAYNSGPEAVEKFNGVPPYTETRRFIKVVYRNFNYFRKQLDPRAKPLKPLLPRKVRK